MNNRIEAFLTEEHITLCGVTAPPAPRTPHILSRAGFALPGEETDAPAVGSLLCLCLPYFSGFPDNFSAYAAAPDYHAYAEGLFARLLPLLRDVYPGHHFAGFADKSPYDEVAVHVAAGLGGRGDNGLFLTEAYSSFVFLAEVASDLPVDAWQCPARTAPDPCTHCGGCRRACPASKTPGNVCLSALTQKKGDLSPDEIAALRKYGSAWGCDICQKVCPVTRRALAAGTLTTPIPYFYEGRITHLSRALIDGMSDDAFAARAFSWRGRATVLRNLDLLGFEE